MDRAKNVIYVFGGRIIAQADTEQNHSYGGLYEYNCASGAWRLLREDMSTGPGHVKLRSRIGHSMLFNERERALYYFAGQRLKEYNSDFYKFMLDTGELVELSRDSSKQVRPQSTALQLNNAALLATRRQWRCASDRLALQVLMGSHVPFGGFFLDALPGRTSSRIYATCDDRLRPK